MALYCVRCGKKLSPVGRINTKEGYICAQCAKSYKAALNDRNIAFEKKTLEELDVSVEKNKQATTKVLVGIIIFIVLAIGSLGIWALFDDEDSKKYSKTENTVAEEKTTQETQETTRTVPTTAKNSRLDDVHDTTKAVRGMYHNMPSYTVYTMAERNPENKAIFLEDAGILLSEYIGCSEETAGGLIETAMARDSWPDDPDYNSYTVIYYEPNWNFAEEETGDLVAEKPNYEEGYSYKIFVAEEWDGRDSEQ